MRLLRQMIRVKLNLEMAVAQEIVDIALDVMPEQATLVPEKREEVTTEGGLDIISHRDRITQTVVQLQERDISVSLFIDPDVAQVDASADLGVEATRHVLESLRTRLDRKDLAASETVMSALKATLTELLADREIPLAISDHSPFVILVVGVNGAGKTTTIGKLAHRFKAQGHSVMLAAGDTFRAAAVEQL